MLDLMTCLSCSVVCCCYASVPSGGLFLSHGESEALCSKSMQQHPSHVAGKLGVFKDTAEGFEVLTGTASVVGQELGIGNWPRLGGG